MKRGMANNNQSRNRLIKTTYKIRVNNTGANCIRSAKKLNI